MGGCETPAVDLLRQHSLLPSVLSLLRGGSLSDQPNVSQDFLADQS